jgi:hypothetical protein
MGKSELELLINEIPGNFWIEELRYLERIFSSYDLKTEDIEIIFRNLTKAIEKNQVGRISNWLTLGLIIDEFRFIAIIRKRGLLKPSKYDFQHVHINQSISNILRSKLCLSDEGRSYLSSFSALFIAGKAVYSCQRKLLEALREGGDVFIRHMFAIVDYQFMLQATKGLKIEKNLSSNCLEHYQPEDLAESVSYIYHLYFSKITFGKPYLIRPFETDSALAEKMLVLASKIKKFQEYEVLIDAFGYSATMDNPTELTIKAPLDGELEIAIRIGYMLNEMQSYISNLDTEYNEVPSIQQLGTDFHDKLGSDLISFKPKPLPRYVFRIPAIEDLGEILSSDSLFKEEIKAFRHAGKEWVIEHERMREFNVSGELTLWDISKTQRLFTFLRWVSASHLLPIKDTEREIVLNSLVMSIKCSDLEELLKLAVGDKALRIIDFLSWNPRSNKVFDIQYQPFINSGDYCSISYNLMSNSNLLRNSLQLSTKRFYQDGTIDPLVDYLAETLRERTEYVGKNISYRWGGRSGEIDVVAMIDGTLFVFECKNSLLPCNAYEIRTSFDYIVKGAAQLDRFSSLTQNKSFMDYFAAKVGWPAVEDVETTTCIVMANRMFSGYRHEGHPVRGSHELISQVSSGIMTIGDKEYCTWENAKFCGNDLKAYIQDDITFRPLWNALVPTRQSYEFEHLRVSLESVSLDVQKASKNYNFREVQRSSS